MTKRETPPAAPQTFAELGLDPRLVKALESLGYEEPTPIQREAIPPLLAGRDVLGQAATGTGKTAAFALPMIQRLGAEKSKDVRGVVLVPTRELAIQVAGAVHRYGRDLGVSVLPVYGGQSLGMQAKALQRGVDVVVATPGRALDLMRRRSFVLESVKAVVLDEADEMLDLGFADDLEAILEATPKTRQTALFSATLPAAHQGAGRAPHARSGPRRHHVRAAAGGRRQAPPGRVHRRARAEGGRPRPRAGHGEPDLRPRLLPHPQRGGRAAGIAGLARLPRGRHPRRA